MVAVHADTGNTLTLKDKLAQDHPQFATTSIAKVNLFPIPQWTLRSGRNEQFDNWHRHALGMFAAWNINKQQIYETSPTLPATPQQPTRKAMAAHHALAAQIMKEWEQIDAPQSTGTLCRRSSPKAPIEPPTLRSSTRAYRVDTHQAARSSAGHGRLLRTNRSLWHQLMSPLHHSR